MHTPVRKAALCLGIACKERHNSRQCSCQSLSQWIVSTLTFMSAVSVTRWWLWKTRKTGFQERVVAEWVSWSSQDCQTATHLSATMQVGDGLTILHRSLTKKLVKLSQRLRLLTPIRSIIKTASANKVKLKKRRLLRTQLRFLKISVKHSASAYLTFTTAIQ